MKMRYKKAIGVINIVLGIIFSCFYFVIALNGKSGSTLLTIGLVEIMFGVLFLTRTYFVVNENNLILHSILGPAKTTYQFQSFKDIKVENNKVAIFKDSKSRSIPISAWMADKKDWLSLLQKINGTS